MMLEKGFFKDAKDSDDDDDENGTSWLSPLTKDSSTRSGHESLSLVFGFVKGGHG